ncbi:MAG: hypothetical protein M5U12_31625 [Verrucomicrobia bacterium]|nr:hypothetical protein [Verrucomicrobiota bacterium]
MPRLASSAAPSKPIASSSTPPAPATRRSSSPANRCPRPPRPRPFPRGRHARHPHRRVRAPPGAPRSGDVLAHPPRQRPLGRSPATFPRGPRWRTGTRPAIPRPRQRQSPRPHHRLRLKDRSAFTDAAQETDHLVGIEGKLRVDGDAHFRQNVGIGTLNPQKNLSVEKGLNLDQADANAGALEPGLTFGSNSTEGLASRRTAGGNHHGLDLYTAATARLSITQAGLVGINTTAPTHRLHINDVRGLRQNRLYLTGGDAWSSLSYNATHNAANNAWEFPDSNRPAVTIEIDDASNTPASRSTAPRPATPPPGSSASPSTATPAPSSSPTTAATSASAPPTPPSNSTSKATSAAPTVPAR